MYSKVKVAGHPVYPMLVAFPVACYTGTLVGFAVYHVGIRPAPGQELAGPTVQHHQPPIPLRRRHAA